MQASTVKQAIKIGAKVAQAGVEAERLRESMTNAVEDTVKSTRRAIKQGQYAVEDLVDEATYAVKRHPLSSVGITLGIGFALGTMVGLALSRFKVTHHCCASQDTQ